MRITKPGNMDKLTPVKQFKCLVCDCEFIALKSECKEEYYERTFEMTSVCECPECHGDVYWEKYGID